MSLNESILHIKLGDLKQLEERIKELASENFRLSSELVEAKLGPDDSVCREYRSAFLDAMPIVRFAIANMNPLSFPGWPHKELVAVAKMLADLPGIDLNQQETAGDLRLFARECATIEKAREEGTEQELLAAMNAGHSSSPPV